MTKAPILRRFQLLHLQLVLLVHQDLKVIYLVQRIIQYANRVVKDMHPNQVLLHVHSVHMVVRHQQKLPSVARVVSVE